MDLRDFFSAHPRPAVAFSGGADSAFLLWSAVRWGVQPTAYYVKTAFQTDAEDADAQQLAESLSVPLRVIRLDALAQDGVAANGPRRCYFCKKAIFTAILAQAAADGCGVVLEGTNASDDVDDRPGWQALQELGVLSPLRLCGLTKPELRRLSREAGLPTWDKPAAACLATRIPTNTPITPEALDRVARAGGGGAGLLRLPGAADGGGLPPGADGTPAVPGPFPAGNAGGNAVAAGGDGVSGFDAPATVGDGSGWISERHGGGAPMQSGRYDRRRHRLCIVAAAGRRGTGCLDGAHLYEEKPARGAADMFVPCSSG